MLDDPHVREQLLLRWVTGLAGALVSLKWMREPSTKWQRALFFIGGVAFSYFGTPWVVKWLAANEARDLISFLLGVYGMGLANKGYEALESVDAKILMESISAFLRKFLPGSK